TYSRHNLRSDKYLGLNNGNNFFETIILFLTILFTKINMISRFYTNLYLRLTQAAYAIVAFPIGTCLSIAPIFLHFQKKYPYPYCWSSHGMW
ncbi:MAG: hypothetical protein ACPGED_07320, partial [Flavobacteriales bacterium]